MASGEGLDAVLSELRVLSSEMPETVKMRVHGDGGSTGKDRTKRRVSPTPHTHHSLYASQEQLTVSAHHKTSQTPRAVSKTKSVTGLGSGPSPLPGGGYPGCTPRFWVMGQADPCALTPDYTVQNLTRMGLAASVLLLLGVLLCQARHDPGGARDAAQS